MTGETLEKRIITEQRLIALLFTILMGVGGWWLQNQWEATMETQRQIADLLKHVDDQYVEKDLFKEVVEDQRTRMTRMENKIDFIIQKQGNRQGL